MDKLYEKIYKDVEREFKQKLKEEKKSIELEYSKKLLEEKQRVNSEIEKFYENKMLDINADQYFDSGNALLPAYRGENKPDRHLLMQKAFELYCEGISVEEIAYKVDMSIQSIERWRAANGWVEKAESILKQAEKKFASEKVKKALAEREVIETEHKNIVRYLMMELRTHMFKPAHTKAEAELKNINIRSTKLGAECYMALIDKERELMGFGKVEPDAKKISTDFIYQIRDESGAVVSHETLAKSLPSQDPFNYTNMPDTISIEPQKQLSNDNGTRKAGELIYPVTTNNPEPTNVIQADPLVTIRNYQEHEKMMMQQNRQAGFQQIFYGNY